VELFPSESRLVDTCNVTHLWCVADPAFCFPFGYEEREVSDARLDQRPFDRPPEMQQTGDQDAKPTGVPPPGHL
jgi:hypothetical protein